MAAIQDGGYLRAKCVKTCPGVYLIIVTGNNTEEVAVPRLVATNIMSLSTSLQNPKVPGNIFVLCIVYIY